MHPAGAAALGTARSGCATSSYTIVDLGMPVGEVPVVLVHGLAAGRYFQALAPRRRIYVLDLPGFGGSEPE